MSLNFTRALEALLWAVGMLCVVSFVGMKLDASKASAQAANKFERNNLTSNSGSGSSESIPRLELTHFNSALPDQSRWSPKRVKSYASANQSENSMEAIALLSIPNLNIRTAVYNETSDKALNLGAGRVPGTASFGLVGNVAIAGHRDGFFRNLKDIAIGDEIQVRHSGGDDTYQVTDTLIVDPSDVSVLEDTEITTITLITCYPFYFIGSAPQRYIVRAELQT